MRIRPRVTDDLFAARNALPSRGTSHGILRTRTRDPSSRLKHMAPLLFPLDTARPAPETPLPA